MPLTKITIAKIHNPNRIDIGISKVEVIQSRIGIKMMVEIMLIRSKPAVNVCLKFRGGYAFEAEVCVAFDIPKVKPSTKSFLTNPMPPTNKTNNAKKASMSDMNISSYEFSCSFIWITAYDIPQKQREVKAIANPTVRKLIPHFIT